MPLSAGCHLSHVNTKLPQPVTHPSCLADEVAGRLGRFDASPAALEQCRSQFVFETADCLRQGRGCSSQPISGVRDAASVDNGMKIGQITQVHS